MFQNRANFNIRLVVCPFPQKFSFWIYHDVGIFHVILKNLVHPVHLIPGDKLLVFCIRDEGSLVAAKFLASQAFPSVDLNHIDVGLEIFPFILAANHRVYLDSAVPVILCIVVSHEIT